MVLSGLSREEKPENSNVRSCANPDLTGHSSCAELAPIARILCLLEGFGPIAKDENEQGALVPAILEPPIQRTVDLDQLAETVAPVARLLIIHVSMLEIPHH